MKVYLYALKDKHPVGSYIIKRALRHFLPAAILTGIILQVRIITDCIIVGHLVGPEAVSAINLYIPLEETFYALLCFLTLGASFLGAEHAGRQDSLRASHYFVVSLAGTGALAVVLVGLIVLFFQPVISLLAGSGDSLIRSYTATYTLCMLPTFLVMAPNSVLRYFVNNDGHPRLVTASILVSFLLNPVLDYVLIRFAGLGMAGAAIATLVSDVAGLAVLVFHFVPGRTSLRLRMPADWPRVLASSIRMGIPLAGYPLLLAVVSVLLNRIVLHFIGEPGLFIWSVAVQVISFCEMFLEGISDMNQSIGGSLLGSCDYKAFDEYARRALRFVRVTMTAVTLLLLFFPRGVFALFGAGDHAAGEDAENALRILALYLLPDLQLVFFTNIYALVRQERLSLVFEILQAAGLALFPVLAGLFFPALFWWSIPLMGVVLCIMQRLAAIRIQRRERNVRAPFLVKAFPAEVEADFDVSYTRGSVDETMEKIRTVALICELPAGKEMFLTICCEELMNNLLLERGATGGQERFEVRIVDKPDTTQVSVKSVGKPFNPVLRFDEDAAERILRGEPVQLELEMVNKLSDRIDHRYMFGVNITSLSFDK